MNSYNGYSAYQRTKAQKWLNKQWESGLLARPIKCCACGQDKGIIDAHAEDYSEPFAAGKTDEYHLCFRCHMMVHFRFRNPEAWTRYKRAIASGAIYEPFYTRNIGGFSGQTLKGTPPLASMGDPHEDVLSKIA